MTSSGHLKANSLNYIHKKREIGCNTDLPFQKNFETCATEFRAQKAGDEVSSPASSSNHQIH